MGRKKSANEPLTSLFSGPLTARFYLLFLAEPLTSRYQFLKALSTFLFQMWLKFCKRMSFGKAGLYF